MFIRDNLSWINIEIACDGLALNRSSYYEWINNESVRTERDTKKHKLVNLIKAEYIQSKKRYGSTKITEILKKSDVVINKKTVVKLMRENDMRSVVNKKFKATTNSKHKLAVFDNILNRQFIVPKPNYAWVGDITYIATDEGWLYLATVIDLYSNKVIGHATSERINKQLVIDALNNALKNRAYPTGVIVHTDRGSHYASNAYKALLKQYKLIGSMSRKGNCWDNAVAENFFGIIKKEYIHQSKFKTRNQGQLGVFDYIEGWYNTQRIHSKLGYLSPTEFEVLNAPCMAIKNIKIGEKMAQL
jgi:transposase InsO family protein